MSGNDKRSLPGSKPIETEAEPPQPIAKASFSPVGSFPDDLALNFRVETENPEAVDRTSRLKEAVRRAGGNKLVASRAGVPVSTLGAYLAGRDWRIGTAVALAEACGVGLDWLATGKGSRDENAAASQSAVTLRDSGDGSRLPTNYVQIPRYDVQASAGSGSEVHDEQMIGLMAFDEMFLRRQLGVRTEGLATIEATGDSMEPTIRDGDLLLIDTEANDLRDGRIYVLNVHGLLAVKRLQVQMDGSIAVSSDNPRYPTQIINPSERDPLSIVGRVVYQAGPVRS